MRQAARKSLDTLLGASPLLILIGFFLFFVYLFENYATEDVAKRLHVWGQFITGSWPREWEVSIDRHSMEFSFWVTLRFVLILGTIASVFRILQGTIIRERREAMGYMELLGLRDAAIKAHIINTLPPDNKDQIDQAVKVLDEAFAKGGKEWAEEYLPILFGPRAKEILDKMEEAVK